MWINDDVLARDALRCLGVVLLGAMSISCGSESSAGRNAEPGPGSTNPCSYTISGDTTGTVDLNAHLAVKRSPLGELTLSVLCMRDPPGSQQGGLSPGFDFERFGELREFVVDKDHSDARFIVGNPSGSVVFWAEGGDKMIGRCAASTTNAPAVPKVGDRIDISFHCEGLVTTILGKTYTADLQNGVIRGNLESVE
ncbi:hypothetical protein LVJ94_51615 [Pendulispora rubella]|uniref:Lipoprotein n=1 Tax=Pendulispora rubella TaxID=2741070 RepID=A0ABZ2L4S3_9BACT